MNGRQANKTIAGLVGGLLVAPSLEIATLWADDLLSLYSQGITACHDLYESGSTHHAEAILPLYAHQTALLAQRSSPPLQQSAARLAAQAKCLACELATDREDFGTAQQEGEQAFSYAQLAGDTNLQVVALVRLANINFHRKFSTASLKDYTQAISLLDDSVTQLLKGRVYAGMAEVYAMRGQRFLQDAMHALGLAYEYYPAKPEEDPAYPLIRSSRYSLYVFGDAQSRLFLGQPNEAEQALVTMQKEINDPQVQPICKLDMLYYQAEIQIHLKILRQEMRDVDLKPDQDLLLYDQPGPYHLYAASAIIRNDKRQHFPLLLSGWFDFFEELAPRGVHLGKIYARILSDSGIMMVRKLFFSPRRDIASNAWELDLSEPNPSRIVQSFQYCMRDI